MALTVLQLKALQKTPVPGRHADGRGLCLRITRAGGMYWQWRLTTPSATTVSYGTYPEISLAQARDLHQIARDQRRNGIDPNRAKRKARLERTVAQGNTFEVLAREWFAVRKPEWAPEYADKVIRQLELDVFPRLGGFPMDEITPVMLLHAMRRIEQRKAFDTAHRCRDWCNHVFRYAGAIGRATGNPAANLRFAMKAPPPVKHRAAITSPERLGDLLRACDAYRGTEVVRAALKLAPMLLLRPGELRHGQWNEIDLGAALWTVPAARMKRRLEGKVNGEPHLVPLSRQAVQTLRELHAITGPHGYVFRGFRNGRRPMSNITINNALRSMGFDTDQEISCHGFRATARTLMAECLEIDERFIEAQLAHTVKDTLGRAYNRTKFMEHRRQMMQVWADYLDGLRLRRPPSNVITLAYQRSE